MKQLIPAIVQARFPALAQLVQQKVATLREPKQLHGLIIQIAMARDEADARDALNA